jgi:hypothetical protein
MKKKEGNRMRYKNTAILLIVATLSLLTAACGIKPAQYGQQIYNRKLTAIKDILANPRAYEGKAVTIEGRIANECSTGCWFFVKVANEDISIYVDTGNSGFAIPQNVGRKILVEGAVKIKERGPMIQAKGVEIK